MYWWRFEVIEQHFVGDDFTLGQRVNYPCREVERFVF